MSTPPTNVTYLGLPVLLDRADGVTKYPPYGSLNGTPTTPVGTPTQAQNVQVSAANGAVTISGIQIEELADSPELERAEQATSTKRFKMPYSTGSFLISVMARGTILQDNEFNQVRILSTTIKAEKPDMCVLTIVSEGLNFDLPPDEFSIEPIELGVDILKFPRYFQNLLPQETDTPIQSTVKQALIRGIQAYRDSQFFPASDNLSGFLSGQIQDNIASQIANGKIVITAPNTNYDSNVETTSDDSWAIQNSSTIVYPEPASEVGGGPNPVNIRVSIDPQTINAGAPDPVCVAAFYAAQEIIQKLWRQEDTPYQVGFQMTWSSYYYIKPFYNPGGYIEDPINDLSLGNPGLPAYFGSPDFDYSVNTIFDAIAQFNPQCYSDDGTTEGATNISWLRKADVIDYQRTWFKVTRTWIGTAQAHWDKDFYNQEPRPGIVNYTAEEKYGYDLNKVIGIT